MIKIFKIRFGKRGSLVSSRPEVKMGFRLFLKQYFMPIDEERLYEVLSWTVIVIAFVGLLLYAMSKM